MADEKFPEVVPGGPIGADRANLEGQVLERVAQMRPGSGMDGRHGGSVLQFGRTLDARLSTLKVTDDSDAPVYLGVLRQYNFQSDEWSDGEKLWKIDAGATDSTLNEDDLVVAYYDRKRGAFIPVVAGIELIAFCLEENHPGRGVLFNIYLGVWNPNDHSWGYDTSTTYKCIDWRFGVPYPLVGATGLGIWRPSRVHGRILEVLSLDCSSPGACSEEDSSSSSSGVFSSSSSTGL